MQVKVSASVRSAFRWVRKRVSIVWLRRILGGLVVLIIAFIVFIQPPSSAPQDALRILDRNGRLLYEVRGDEGLRQSLPYDRIPKHIIHAVTAIEDREFFEHHGVSAKAILRAAKQNVQEGRIISGGSTITQQLVKNLVKPTSRGYLYKAYEAILAFKLDHQLSKEQILTDYLNSSYFGHQAYGIAAAAKTYFGKDVSELSLSESTLLIGLLQSPSRYDPFRSIDRAKKRQAFVLQAMTDTNVITQAQADDAQAERIRLAPDVIDIEAPHFVMWVTSDETTEDYDDALRTTLDLSLQHEVETIVKNHIDRLKDKRVTSAAVVVLDAHTGDILSMAGSADYFDAEHDGAVNAAISQRQPGSAIKPFTYAAALMRGHTAATTVADVETQFFTQSGNPYIPRNYDYGYHGLVRYREALANSYNIAAVKVLERIGVESLMNLLRQAGITTVTETPGHYGLALTLGDAEVTLLELTQAYGVFARGGKTLSVRSRLDEPVSDGHQTLSQDVAWIISDILSDTQARLAEFGESDALSFPFPVAVKTGTTRNSRDNWTVGYTPDRIVGVWVGNADNSPMLGTSGVTGAGPIFHDVMMKAMQNIPHRNFEKPDNIVETRICKLSGKLATELCPHTMTEYFARGKEPNEWDDVYRRVRIDSRNGLLASDACDESFVHSAVFAIFPQEVEKWARENGLLQPPSDYSPLCSDHTVRDHGNIIITRPHNGSSFLIDPLIPEDAQQLILQASASSGIRQIEWFVDDRPAGIGQSPDFIRRVPLVKGPHTIKARSSDDEAVAYINVE